MNSAQVSAQLSGIKAVNKAEDCTTATKYSQRTNQAIRGDGFMFLFCFDSLLRFSCEVRNSICELL